MPFIQALVAIGYRPVPLSGGSNEKVVDIAIQRTLVEIRRRHADVLLVSNDGDFVDQIRDLLDGRRVGVVGFQEFRSNAFLPLVQMAYPPSTSSTRFKHSKNRCRACG